MKKSLLIFFVFLFLNSNAQQIIFNDSNFKSKLLLAGSNNQIAKNIEGIFFKIDSNSDDEISQSEALQVSELFIDNSNITSLQGLEYFTAITVLNCNSNQITNLSLNSLDNLIELNCAFNQLQNLNLTYNNDLEIINCNNNQLVSLNLRNGICETSISFENNSNLLSICLDNCQLLQLKNLVNLYGYTNCSGYYNCDFNTPNVFDIVDIPDPVFKSVLLSANSSNQKARYLNYYYGPVDINNDQEIQISEALNILELNLNDPAGISYFPNILSIQGITSFTNIGVFRCENHDLTSADFTGLNLLRQLWISQNNIIELNISGLNSLQNLDCKFNEITSLIVNNLPNLYSLDCQYNQLTTLDISNNIGGELDLALLCNNNQISSLNLANTINLSILECQFNNLQTLNVTNLNKLETLWCHNNQISSLDLTNLNQLSSINCQNNLITTLNFSNILSYVDIKCKNNLLESLFVKNGYSNSVIDFSLNPSIQYICIDEQENAIFQNKLVQYGYSNCNINSYCSFVPGGTFFNISGNTKLDLNVNGCNSSDINFPNVKFGISSSNTTGTIISDSSGNYSIPLQAGMYTITPILENPSYYTITPPVLNVNLSNQTGSFLQNFCVSFTPKPDLEVIILPFGPPARPGFETSYKIIYKNKGNIPQSGAINFNYDDAILDLVLSNPLTSSSAENSLSWNFNNLQPLTSGEIIIKLSLNSPMEIPSVNGGDILNFIATATSAATDVFPLDNSAIFNQTVVNSFDPNDKTCIEGNVLNTTQIGKYLHYLIRFENTGTANAENIVVKDIIDTTKYEIASIVPLDSSHPFYTRVTNSNNVEFIFANINLSFDDANNDGYIAFKIKTKPNLVTGNSVSNSAEIYFDYNFPILTNTAITTFQTLKNDSFNFDNNFIIFPNPTSEYLNIESKSSNAIKSIDVLNILGQQIFNIKNPQKIKTIDVKSLNRGSYILKIKTEQKYYSTVFIKE